MHGNVHGGKQSVGTGHKGEGRGGDGETRGEGGFHEGALSQKSSGNVDRESEWTLGSGVIGSGDISSSGIHGGRRGGGFFVCLWRSVC